MNDSPMVIEQDLEVEAPQYRYGDGEIVASIRDEIVGAGGSSASRIEEQREEAYGAYYGEYPEALAGVASQHRSRDVLDAVEGVKTKLLRSFTATRSPVYFESTGRWDVEGAELATNYTKKVFYQQNPGYRLLNWAFHDALLSKVCILKRSYVERRKRIPEKFEDVPCEQVEMIAGRDDVEVAEISAEKVQTAVMQTPYGVVTQSRRVCSGVVYRVEDDSGIKVDVIPPEDFGVSANARTLEEATACWERHDYTRSELVGMGFDPDVVATLNGHGLVSPSAVHSGRHRIDDSYQVGQRGKNERMLIPTYEVYYRIDMDDDDEAELWQFIIAGTTILRKERVAEVPYLLWSPFLLSHKAVGMSMADVTIDIQRTNSNVVRGMVDHIYRTNNPTKIANLSGTVIKNPQDLLNNPPGLLIDSSDPNAVSSVRQPDMNPATFNVLEILRQEKESRTGLSRLAQGLNGDAISNQNAEDMIAALMNASNERILEMARSFAELVLKPLFEGIYRLGYENDHLVEMARKGQLGQVTPKMLGYRPNMTVNVALTEEEIARRAQALVGVYGLMRGDEELAALFGLEERYGVVVALLDLAGFPSSFIANPSDPETQRRLQAVAIQKQQQQQKAEALAAAPLKLEAQRIAGDLKIKRDRLDLDSAMGADKMDLDELQFEWQQRVDAAEFQLERNQRRPVSLQ